MNKMHMAQISDNAKKQLEKNKQWREEPPENSQFIKIPPGTSKTLLFDTEDMSIETVEFDPKKGPVKRAKYGVFDVTTRSTIKQWFTGGKNVSNAIDSNLEEGNTVLKISRQGEGFDTRYTVVATSVPSDYNSPL